MPFGKDFIDGVVDGIVKRLFTRPIKMNDGGLANDPHTDSEGQARVSRWVQVITFINASTGRIINAVSAAVPIPARTTVPALRITDVNVQDRYMGELLLEDDPIALNGGAVAGTAFNTRGHSHLFVTVTNPTWATNPATITVSVQVSPDAFDTLVFDVMALNGVIILQNLTVADADMRAFVVPIMSNAGAIAATNTPQAAPIPDINGLTARLYFTPTGAGITAEEMVINVYGSTPR